ncbi:hypothetical protein KO507_12485 [Gilvimarinus agarilyticus]|uniref:hypothetical protein n=1 Tax=Gilvimarinus sp. 2_MG-2023 TaxID=3062666 RepID=UPI001C098E11|nr:hypothetical protein [Gilvimarinus sp. 2_MG-2023]MBU2886581.1 hypothetical protein [Gilvimarinus agarilyticus]MDO6571249.1 hypothetical protein [Gilvimarinus sp. 2_MG-2023]
MWRVLGVAVLAMVQLIACSSVPSYGSTPESLGIDVLPNGSKQFVYRVGLPPEVEARLNPRARPGRPPGERDYRKLQNRTLYVVTQTGYCRSGYFELDYRLGNQVQWIRGECREGASAEDERNFAERQQLPLDALE